MAYENHLEISTL